MSLVDILGRVQVGSQSPHSLTSQINSSDVFVQKLELQRKLEGHTGCVNTVSWTPCGSSLISSSDDLNVIFWEANAGYFQKLRYTSGHFSNVFQSRALPQSNNATVVSCAADGQVRAAYIPEGTRGNNEVPSKRLARHRGRAHKLALEPHSPKCFYSCGEDGEVLRFDLREPEARTNCLLVCRSIIGRPLELNSIHCNPLNPNQFCVAGADQYVRVYDKRRNASSSIAASLAQPARKLVPHHLQNRHPCHLDLGLHITCAVYSQKGDILASYNDENAYLFAREGYRTMGMSMQKESTPCGSKRPREHCAADRAGGSHRRQNDVAKSNNTAKTTALPPPPLMECSSDDGNSSEDGQDELADAPPLLIADDDEDDHNQEDTGGDIEASGEVSTSVSEESLPPVLVSEDDDGDFNDNNRHVAPAGGSAMPVLMSDDSDAIADLESELESDFNSDSEIASSIEDEDDSEDEWVTDNGDSDEDDDIFDHRYGYEEDFLRDCEIMSGSGPPSLRSDYSDLEDEEDGLKGPAGSCRRNHQRRRRATFKDPGQDEVLQTYKGHRNAQTIKGINFMGDDDSFVVSGSDCGHIFVWGTVDGRLKAFWRGDAHVVNCLEPHPIHPLTLATSGIDEDIKIWAPTGRRLIPGREADLVMSRNRQTQGNHPAGLVTHEMLNMLFGSLPLGALNSGDEDDEYGEDEEDDDEMGDGIRPECVVS